jgi:hypothetical protein
MGLPVEVFKRWKEIQFMKRGDHCRCHTYMPTGYQRTGMRGKQHCGNMVEVSCHDKKYERNYLSK